ncbi:MAG: hypothetical protein M1814_006296 [Vezdaea aestivalis]|nr:MAG: hypothetical protein M1814_006296 [Vezdaea aestivalis]
MADTATDPSPTHITHHELLHATGFDLVNAVVSVLHPQPELTVKPIPNGICTDTVLEQVWEACKTQILLGGGFEVILPLDVSRYVCEDMTVIVKRLCDYIGDGTEVVVDRQHNAVRIFAAKNKNMTTVIEPIPVQKGRLPAAMSTDKTTKQKIARPPNSFILYRQYYHPIVVADNPGIHNNDVSRIVGAKWKDETLAIKNHFKTLADHAKKEHEQKNPLYQYAPRKPSEKKRRMTRTKAAKLADKLRHKSDIDHLNNPSVYTGDLLVAGGSSTQQPTLPLEIQGYPGQQTFTDMVENFNDSLESSWLGQFATQVPEVNRSELSAQEHDYYFNLVDWQEFEEQLPMTSDEAVKDLSLFGKSTGILTEQYPFAGQFGGAESEVQFDPFDSDFGLTGTSDLGMPVSSHI